MDQLPDGCHALMEMRYNYDLRQAYYDGEDFTLIPGEQAMIPAIWTNLFQVSREATTFSFAQVLTKDSVTVSVDAVVYYRVSNATVSVANVENAHHSTRLLAQTTLRNILGTKNLHEILSDRESISGSMQVC